MENKEKTPRPLGLVCKEKLNLRGRCEKILRTKKKGRGKMEIYNPARLLRPFTKAINPGHHRGYQSKPSTSQRIMFLPGGLSELALH
jgi:hypothetical protein